MVYLYRNKLTYFMVYIFQTIDLHVVKNLMFCDVMYKYSAYVYEWSTCIYIL